MKSGKKKRLISLLALVIVLAAVFVAYYVVTHTEEDSGVGDYVSPYTSIISENSADLVKLSYKLGKADSIEFTLNNYVWKYSGDPDFPVDQYTLNEMATAISSVSSVRELEDGDNGEYGLGEDALRITAEYSTGNTYDITIGDKNSFNSYTYLKNKDGRVYMFNDDELSENFSKSLYDLLRLDDPEADVDTNYLVSLDVSDGAGRTNVISDTAGMRQFLDQSDKYTCLDWISYAMTDEKFSEYGIGPDSARLIIRYKAAVAVTDVDGNDTAIREERAYEIIFGDRLTAPDENGADAEYVYYTVTGSSILYKAPIADYEETMGYLDYIPEDDEDTAEASPDTDEAVGSDSGDAGTDYGDAGTDSGDAGDAGTDGGTAAA